MQWITSKEPLCCPRFVKSFFCDKPVASAILQISGLGLYRALLNWKRIGEDYLTPGFNDYDAYVRYQTYDVTALLQEENMLQIYTGNGWYKGRIGWPSSKHSDTNRWGDSYCVAACLTLTYTDGETKTIETDSSWLAGKTAFLENSIYDGEVRDDTHTLFQCDKRCVPAEKQFPLEPQASPCVQVKETLKPTLIITPKGEQVLDFGQNFSGIFRFVNRLPRGAKLYIQTGEVLQQGCFYRDNLRSAKSEYTYISDGAVKEIEPYFTFYGFRYLKVEGLEKVDPTDFTGLVLSSGLKETLQVSTGHKLINQLMHNSLWGQRSNFLDVPTDCPQRDERLGWTADTQVFVPTACYQMDCKAFYRKFMRDMRIDQTLYLNGDLPSYSPSLKGDAGSGGAVWADAGTIIPWAVYEAYGDEALLAENYPMMRDYAEKLIQLDQQAGGSHLYFPYHTYGDWLAQDGLTPQTVYGGTDHAYIQGVYYRYSLQLTAQAAKLLGKAEDAAKYDALAEEIHQALLDEYVSPNGNLTVDTQTAYVLALKHHIYRNREKLLVGFRKRLRRDFYRITSGFTGAPIMLPVLFDNGLSDIAYRMLLTEQFPGWLYCVKLGATTIWERWNSLDEKGNITGIGMNSLNHYAYGSVCEAIYSRIMGLRCTAPGWKKALIAPVPDGRLGHAEIRYESVAGTWQVRWQLQKNGMLSLDITVPEGAEAEVLLPAHPDAKPLTLSGEAWHTEYMPTVDYRHPFDENTMLLDLLPCPALKELVLKYKPGLAQDLPTGNEKAECLLKTVADLSHSLSEEDRAAFLGAIRSFDVCPE